LVQTFWGPPNILGKSLKDMRIVDPKIKLKKQENSENQGKVRKYGKNIKKNTHPRFLLLFLTCRWRTTRSTETKGTSEIRKKLENRQNRKKSSEKKILTVGFLSNLHFYFCPVDVGTTQSTEKGTSEKWGKKWKIGIIEKTFKNLPKKKILTRGFLSNLHFLFLSHRWVVEVLRQRNLGEIEKKIGLKIGK
jgi:hypothetical protein